MAKKSKHPIVMAVLVIGLVAVVLGGVLVGIFRIAGTAPGIAFVPRIGVVPIEGTIADSDSITSHLIDLTEDKGIKAIILRIDSPGGGVASTQEIYREVQKSTKVKKVVASMGGVAASGGYYIAAAADKIVADPGTITGSIGVVMEFVRLQDLLGKIGIELEVLKSGEFKDIGSPHRKMTDRDREILQGLISDIQDQFVQAVADGRSLAEEDVRKIADGRVFTGARAKDLGLVDVLGNFQDAVEIAKGLAGIEGEVSLVYPEGSTLELWDLLLKTTLRSIASVVFQRAAELEYRWSGLSAFD